jgi:hypothetical protein
MADSCFLHSSKELAINKISSMYIKTLKPRNLKWAMVGLKILVNTRGAKLYPNGK